MNNSGIKHYRVYNIIWEQTCNPPKYELPDECFLFIDTSVDYDIGKTLYDTYGYNVEKFDCYEVL